MKKLILSILTVSLLLPGLVCCKPSGSPAESTDSGSSSTPSQQTETTTQKPQIPTDSTGSETEPPKPSTESTEDAESTGSPLPKPPKPSRDLAQFLVSSWDFFGKTDEDRLRDKSGNGASVESILLNGKASVSDGRLTVPDGVGTYASIPCPDNSDFFDFRNKTVLFRASISSDPDRTSDSLVAGCFSKKSAYDIYFSNISSGRMCNLRINAAPKQTLTGTVKTTLEEFRIYAISLSVPEGSANGELIYYRSTVPDPISPEQFEELFRIPLGGLTETSFVGNDSLYLGKRHDHTEKERTMISEFSNIRLYSTVLSKEEISFLSSDLSETPEHALADLNRAIAEAETINQGSIPPAEWEEFLNILKHAKKVAADGTDLSAIREATGRLRSAIDNTSGKPVADHIQNLRLIPYNNPDLSVPIRSGLHCYPGFYDIDGNGKPDLILSGRSRSYGGEGGGCFLYRNNLGKGSVDFGPTEQIAVNFRPIFSYFADGTPAFVERDGTVYTKLDKNGGVDGQSCGITRYFKFYDMDGDGVSDAVYEVGSSTGTNNYDSQGNSLLSRSSTMYWVKNTGTNEHPVFGTSPIAFKSSHGGSLTVHDDAQYTYIRSFSMFDWDGDGDLDLIAGGWMNEYYYYENVGSAENPVFNPRGVKIETLSGPLELEACRYNIINYDWDGDGMDDLIIGSESGTALYLRFTGKFNPDTHAPVFEDGVYFQQKAEYLGVNVLSRPTACDWDGDGDIDFIVGDNGGYLWLIENLGGNPASFAAPVKLTDETGKILVIKAGPNGSLQGAQEAEWGYTIPCACDWDGDGDVDILVNSVTGRVLWFENIGTKEKPQLTQPKPLEVEWENGNKYPSFQWWKPEGKELVTQHRTTPFGMDFNGDGLCDLVMMDHEGYLAFFERYSENGVLKLKEGKRIFLNENGTPFRLNDQEGGQCGRIKFAITDWDGDGIPDVIVNTGTGVRSFWFYKTVKRENGYYYLRTQENLSPANIAGHHPGFTIVDWNGDGKPDIITGCEAGYFYYLENQSK